MKKRIVLGEGYYCGLAEYCCSTCGGSEGDYIGLADKNGKRLDLLEKIKRPIQKKFKLVIEYEKTKKSESLTYLQPINRKPKKFWRSFSNTKRPSA